MSMKCGRLWLIARLLSTHITRSLTVKPDRVRITDPTPVVSLRSNQSVSLLSVLCFDPGNKFKFFCSY